MDSAPYADEAHDPRRGFLWPGAAPMAGGSGRVSIGAMGGWLLTEPPFLDVPVPIAGVGAELSAAWAPSKRLAVTVAGGGGGLTSGDAALAAMGTARFLVADGEKVRVAPWVAGGHAGSPFVAGGVALELPFYDVLFDVSLPVGGAAFGETVRFVPTMLLFEAGFTWGLGEHTSVRLGYLAAAGSVSWRWTHAPWTVEIGGNTNIVSGNLATRFGVAF